MLPRPSASFSQSMIPWRATATHFVPKTVIFQPPQNAIICYRTPKILILGPCMYCKQRSMYCKHKYMVQRCRLYVAKTQIICCKYKNYMLQIYIYVSQMYNCYAANIECLCCKYTISVSQIHNFYVANTDILCCKFITKYGAAGAVPAGAFSPRK